MSRLRAVFNWALRVGYLEASPFTRHGVSVVRLARETPRSRRLHDDEESALLSKSQPHLAALIVGALETGMRLGELLDLRWRQVEGCITKGLDVTWDRRAVIVLVAEQTKTRRARRIPISTRLRAVLELRRFDPDAKPLPPEAHVFGNLIGQHVGNINRAWYASVLRAHGHTPRYTDTKNLDETSRAALEAVGLHFHDLRREAGSRWLDGGVPLHTIRDWLGHSNISQTSTYLAGTVTSQHDAMAQYEARLAAVQQSATGSKTGGRKRTPSAGSRDRKTNKTTTGHGPTMM